jgi:putative ABC transport system permease protein
MHTSIDRSFLSQRLQDMYADIVLQGTAISLGAGLAVVIAALGLFGLSAHSTEQRTKEIGIRKSMGAGTGDIMRLLMWQFTKPVLWANLIAWPSAWFLMSGWLQGFAHHVNMQPALFAASSALALVIALLTVSVHCWLVARAKPVAALRYE